jgi:hypothetical protein
MKVYKKKGINPYTPDLIMWQLARFTQTVTILIETNPTLTHIAKMELYAAIDTLTHNVLLFNREQDMKRAAIFTRVPCSECPTRQRLTENQNQT